MQQIINMRKVEITKEQERKKYPEDKPDQKWDEKREE
jgi:hypothetical protein